MSVHDAKPGDVYADRYNKLWRVKYTCPEPTVSMEEIEPSRGGGLISSVMGHQPPETKTGGVSGLMWEGFRRILTGAEDKPF